ncbi:hypothetical protein WJX73_010123 [Symbiochloris irregularis]|uniref:Beta-1,4-galactosyltransferase 7 n=1 Tax=Symbiochloris irregularis TaxID=706552 RepID=A0AAW1P102_9CHLO
MLSQQRRGRGQSRLAAWQGFALLLLLTAAALLYVKYQAASKRRVLLADIDLSAFLLNQGRHFDIFVIEQTPGLHFNRGALLNAGVLLLQASAYDYFIFHDVDTIPTEAGNIPYAYPEGLNPMHLTPPGIHPKGIRYEDFFGGIAAFSTEQMTAVNGFGTNFWGWGREDDNMRERLVRLGRWPPQKPDVSMNKGRRFYFKHAPHIKALEVRMSKSAASNATEYSAVNPDKPYKQSLIVSSQPENFLDFKTGLNTTAFRVVAVQPIASLAVRYIVDLHCDRTKTPWCQDTHR